MAVADCAVMTMKNRIEAARQLAEKLRSYEGKNPLVLGIPRGAVPMAEEIARELQGEMDIVLMRKISAPYYPEIAVGSVAEHGERYVLDYASEFGATPQFIEQEVKAALEGLHWRRLNYDSTHEPVDPFGRIVIVVDDGVATGSTLIGALRVLRNRRPAKLIAAVGVASKDVARRLEKEADEVVCLETPEQLRYVSTFFEDYAEVTEAEVAAILRRRPSSVRR